MASFPGKPGVGQRGVSPVVLGAAWFAYFAALFLSLTAPIDDPDFWWHLASGKWMWEHGSLLRTDPFSIDPGGSSPDSEFILRQYWLAQLIQYCVYSLGGFQALVLLRAGVHTLMFYLLRRVLVGVGAGNLLCAVLLLVSIEAIRREAPYVADRPQMWSSLFAVALLGCFEALRRDRRWSRWALPALTLFWANMHGGFLYGDALLVALMLGALLTRTGHPALYRTGGLALLASAVNPNGFAAAGYVFGLLPAPGGAAGPSSIAEMQSIFAHAPSLSAISRWLPGLTSLALASAASWLLLVARPGRRRLDLLLPYLLVTAMGLRAIRFLVIYVPVAALVTAANAAAVFESLRAGWLARARRAAPWAALVVLALGAYRLLPHGVSATALAGAPSYRAPAERAAAFIKSRGLKGNVFNEYSLGGYLIWALWPGNRVFIDGRGLSAPAWASYKIAMDDPERHLPASGGELPAYRQILNAQRADLVVSPGCDPRSGALLGLFVALMKDPEWAPVYVDDDTLVFARATAENRSLIPALRVQPGAIGDHLMALVSASSRDPHSNRLPFWRYTMAYAHFLKGDAQRALVRLDEYLALVPRDEVARQVRDGLRGALRP